MFDEPMNLRTHVPAAPSRSGLHRFARWLARPFKRRQAKAGHSADALNLKDAYRRIARTQLQAFLSSRARLEFPRSSSPVVSMLAPLWNGAELTLTCLQSLERQCHVPFELILVDNGSQDETSQLLDRVSGASILRNEQNLGFGGAMNQAARVARSKYLLFLNNDLQVIGDGLSAATRYLDDQTDVAAVGGKIILLDGSLQEAGCTLNAQGFPNGRGRGESPDDPRYHTICDVAYCSAALLLTRRMAFEEQGGFDPQFHPGYYEDADYCMTLRERGARVVYHPALQGLHFESASLPPSDVATLCRRNRGRFLAKHAKSLESLRA